MKNVNKAAVTLALVAFAVASAHAQNLNASGPPVLAKAIATAKGGGTRLMVTSSSLSNGSAMDEKYTQSGENMSPPLTWSRGPTGTQSFVVLVEDSGVDRPEPIVHWVVYDIPSTVRRLPLRVPGDAELENGAKQGMNVSGKTGYLGPKPPAGQTHPYHFQVFALNTRLDIDPAKADRNTVVNAMKGHVLSQGDLVTNYTGK